MKKFNLFAMGLLAAATVSFTACSSNDDLSGAQTEQSKADGFYMTMTIKMPQSNGTRTTGDTTQVATEAESYVTSGTFFLVDETTNTVAYKKVMSKDDWEDSKNPVQGQDGKTTLSVSVKNVTVGTKYKVYFLANVTDKETPWGNDIYSLTEEKSLDNLSKFSGKYSVANSFAMFNENDKEVDANNYTVTFTEKNKTVNNAAKIMVGEKEDQPIKIERVTARIDEPTSKASTINKDYPSSKEYSSLSDAEKKKIQDALDKVSGVILTRYAISNLSNTTYLMQHWNEDWNMLIPSNSTQFSYIQPTSEFGDKTSAQNIGDKGYFKAVTDKSTGKDYVFENNSTDAPTTMYFEYKVELNTNKFTDTPDCTDGTFYRFENKVYRSLQAIVDAYATQTSPFGAKTVAELKEVLKINTGDNRTIGADETALKKFREDYNIEVFRGGLCYYKTSITDSNQDNAAMILRNTIYDLTVNNVYNIGADVPNGDPNTVEAMYYVDITVSINKWIQSTQSVDLQ